jgi:hypothetical protein
VTTSLVPTTLVPTAVDALDRIDALLDLSAIRFKLAHPEDGDAPTGQQLDTMEAEYRKFLALRLAHPDVDIVPCKLVDEMWHRHILDTRAYADDCELIFGGFMHHFPYFGLRGEADAQALAEAYADTIERYRTAFGEPPEDTWISLDAAARCKRTACKPQQCR